MSLRNHKSNTKVKYWYIEYRIKLLYIYVSTQDILHANDMVHVGYSVYSGMFLRTSTSNYLELLWHDILNIILDTDFLTRQHKTPKLMRSSRVQVESAVLLL